MESLAPSSNNSTHQLECKPCDKVFKHSWDTNRHLLSRKHTGGNSIGLDCVPVCRRGCNAQGPISRLKSGHLEQPRINSPEEGQNLPQRIKSHARKPAKEKLNEHEKAFMKERIRIEEKKIGANLVRLEMVLKADGILQTEVTTLQGELEYSNKLIWHFRDMLH
ncbi:unnamed protein product [Orchesella dallaii]|uniref:C2H2-type domain-containing protein n=1 Tax=Orchesella dallaii TaxID=48710 RepID=A0ABP1R975_9HEXA